MDVPSGATLPAALAAARVGDEDGLRRWSGDLANERDSEGRSALHHAAAAGSLECVSIALERGVDPNATTKSLVCALHVAAKVGDVEILKKLVEGGASSTLFDRQGRLPLHVAVVSGHLEAAKFLASQPGVAAAAPNKNGLSCLHFAAVGGSVRLGAWSVEQGCTVDAPSVDGLRPLHHASARGHSRMVRWLVRAKGASVTVTDARGATPLHMAVASPSDDVIAVLLLAGADAAAADTNGVTPTAIAARRKRVRRREEDLDGGRKDNFEGGSAKKDNFDGGSAKKDNFEGGSAKKDNFEGGSAKKDNFDGGSAKKDDVSEVDTTKKDEFSEGETTKKDDVSKSGGDARNIWNEFGDASVWEPVDLSRGPEPGSIEMAQWLLSAAKSAPAAPSPPVLDAVGPDWMLVGFRSGKRAAPTEPEVSEAEIQWAPAWGLISSWTSAKATAGERGFASRFRVPPSAGKVVICARLKNGNGWGPWSGRSAEFTVGGEDVDDGKKGPKRVKKEDGEDEVEEEEEGQTDDKEGGGMPEACRRAALRGDVAVVRGWMQSGVRVMSRDDDGRTVLHLAASEGWVGACRELLALAAEEAPSLLEARDRAGATALLVACVAGQVETTALLLKEGASMETSDKKGFGPLHYAAAKGHSTIVRFLLEAGASPAARTLKGQTAESAIRTHTPALLSLLPNAKRPPAPPASVTLSTAGRSSAILRVDLGRPAPGAPPAVEVEVEVAAAGLFAGGATVTAREPCEDGALARVAKALRLAGAGATVIHPPVDVTIAGLRGTDFNARARCRSKIGWSAWSATVSLQTGKTASTTPAAAPMAAPAPSGGPEIVLRPPLAVETAAARESLLVGAAEKAKVLADRAEADAAAGTLGVWRSPVAASQEVAQARSALIDGLNRALLASDLPAAAWVLGTSFRGV